MDVVFPLIIGIAVTALTVASIAWHFSRSQAMLEQWAATNGFEILHSEYRHVFRGPFVWTTSKYQAVYYVRLRDRHGAERTAWVRIGGWILGLLSRKTEVRWQE